jgi:hypothetical protein
MASDNEHKRITRSYETPLTREEMKKMVAKALIKFQKMGGKSIGDMSAWLELNNFDNYQQNKWVRAMVETLFSRKSGMWIPINQHLSIDQLTDAAMNFWKNKFVK